jgi:hypothetical protein
MIFVICSSTVKKEEANDVALRMFSPSPTFNVVSLALEDDVILFDRYLEKTKSYIHQDFIFYKDYWNNPRIEQILMAIYKYKKKFGQDRYPFLKALHQTYKGKEKRMVFDFDHVLSFDEPWMGR